MSNSGSKEEYNIAKKNYPLLNLIWKILKNIVVQISKNKIKMAAFV